MNHSVKRRRQALHQTHHHYYLNISVRAANLSDWRIESKLFCPNWNALLQRSCSGVDYTYCSLPLWLGRTPLQRQKHTAVSYDFMLPTVILIIIIGIPSPTHSFIPGLNPSFSANPSHRSFLFSFSPLGLTTWIPQTFTVPTSEHIRFYFFCFTLFSCRFRAVDYFMSAFGRTLK